MTTSIVDIFTAYKNESDTTANSVATTYANLDIEWVVKDGNQTISANTSWGSATPDTRNLLVLVKGNLTVDAGYTLTAAARKRGMFIYVNGDLNLNGIISMTARGASAAGAKLLLFDDGTEYQIPAAGGVGGAGVSIGGVGVAVQNGNSGTSGAATNACGGGASGGVMKNGAIANSGAGAAGTSYSGGSAGGGASAYGGTYTATAGATNGGAGGEGKGYYIAIGGTGNPGGVSKSASSGYDGTGGLLVIYVTGTITFGAAGSLTSTGTQARGGNMGGGNVGQGGASGGGHIDLFYKALSGTPSYDVSGGALEAITNAPNAGLGGLGGDGSSRATEVSLPDLMAAATSSNFFMFF